MCSTGRCSTIFSSGHVLTTGETSARRARLSPPLMSQKPSALLESSLQHGTARSRLGSGQEAQSSLALERVRLVCVTSVAASGAPSDAEKRHQRGRAGASQSCKAGETPNGRSRAHDAGYLPEIKHCFSTTNLRCEQSLERFFSLCLVLTLYLTFLFT